MRRISFLVCVLLACVVSPQWLQAQIITFDAPGAGTISGQGTIPNSINPSGTVTGFDRDANWVRHAFVRSSHGSITIIDDPHAGTCSSPCGSANSGPGTRAYSINAAGTIIGYYTATPSGPARGFARSSGGTFTAIDAPDAGTDGTQGQGTYPGSQSGPYTINQAGVITGFYVDSLNGQHGFVRTTDGTITEFDAPNSFFTFPYAINQAGVIVGDYGDTVTGNVRGFVRDPDGTITAFDAPNAGTSPGQGTFPGGITASGTFSGNYQDSSNVNHGFVGVPGDFTTFDAPGAGTGMVPPGQGTFIDGSNPSGAITGFYADGSGVNHGFVRAKQGAITTFDAPGAGTSTLQGTVPVGINPSGAITGSYVDGSGVSHGFVRTP